MPEQPAATPPDEPEPEPLNRAERRARQRGKRTPPPSDSRSGPVSSRDRPVVPRRSGRRGNR